jgi:hypothetical protein
MKMKVIKIASFVCVCVELNYNKTITTKKSKQYSTLIVFFFRFDFKIVYLYSKFRIINVF